MLVKSQAREVVAWLRSGNSVNVELHDKLKAIAPKFLEDIKKLEEALEQERYIDKLVSENYENYMD